MASANDFVYCDPPYIGRHVDYYDRRDLDSEIRLRDSLNQTQARYMVSTWEHNKYRRNECVDSVWGDCNRATQEHFYHVGAREENRNAMTEALLMNYQPNPDARDDEKSLTQTTFDEMLS